MFHRGCGMNPEGIREDPNLSRNRMADTNSFYPLQPSGLS